MGIRAYFDQLLAEITAAAGNFYGERLITVAVFGSVGRNTPRPDSDIDLLLIADNLPKGRMNRMAEFVSLETVLEPWLKAALDEGIETSLSPVIKTREEVCRGSLLFLDMVEDARILYDRDGFFAAFLDRFRKRLMKLGAKRIRQGNAWYWVLKEDYQVGETFEI